MKARSLSVEWIRSQCGNFPGHEAGDVLGLLTPGCEDLRSNSASGGDHVRLSSHLERRVALWDLDHPDWAFPRQFERHGEHLSLAEREQLLLRTYHSLNQDSQELFPSERTHQLQSYVEASAGGATCGDDCYRYPWDSLEADLCATPGKTIFLFGFGSLVNSHSASFHLRRRSGPAIAFGLKRVFNYEDHYIHHCNIGKGCEEHPLEKAKLNAALAEDPCHMINGVLYEIDVEDLISLRPRERGYDLEPLPVIAFNDELKDKDHTPDIIKAYFLRATAEQQTNPGLLPDPAYLNVCCEGVLPFGHAFARLFLDTTFLGDGVTPLSLWLAEQVRAISLRTSAHRAGLRTARAMAKRFQSGNA